MMDVSNKIADESTFFTIHNITFWIYNFSPFNILLSAHPTHLTIFSIHIHKAYYLHFFPALFGPNFKVLLKVFFNKSILYSSNMKQFRDQVKSSENDCYKLFDDQGKFK